MAVLLDFPYILTGLLLSGLIGGLAYRRRSLTRSGWAGAILTGTLCFGFGRWICGITLIIFFVSSSALSHFRQARKQQIAGDKFEKGSQRDLFQVLANGGLAALLALAYGLSHRSPVFLAAFAGILGTVTADTWATEIGVLSPHPPRLITTGQPAEPGTSGGISLYGSAAAFAGALTIGLMLLLLGAFEQGVWHLGLLLAATLGGFAGSLADSLLGATVQAIYRSTSVGATERAYAADGTANQLTHGWRWMNNDMVNFLSSIVGGLLAVGISQLIY